ncbi:MAG TPA: rhodanese-like domain-containing protein [Sandaracinaceae bacterium LLY-WYZ-13_1]|nr:rhodanese-like domain-containing protein [Sandaracinaceae bacterium LLY-WYZ-13_1]
MKRAHGWDFAMALAVSLATGCSEEPEAAAVPELSVGEVAGLLEQDEAVAVDANGASTRDEHGVIPGAVLLSSSGSYDPSELPSDPSTSLVFYCANTDCRASDGAAERAREHGYEDVKVMRAGIAGWVEAGHETARPSS